MVGALASFMVMAVAGRELSAEASVAQILVYRSAVCLVIVAGFLAVQGGAVLATGRWRAHVGRNVVHFAGQYGWFLGLSLIPLAEVFAIEFTTPIWTAILATLFLGERLTRRRWLAVGLGFLGILVILRPGLAAIHPAALAVLGAAFAYAVTYVMTRDLGRTERPLTIVFYMNLIQLPLGLALAVWDWAWLSPGLWPWALAVGVGGFSSHYCLSRALKLAEAAIVAPLDYIRLPLIAVVGYLVYAEPVDPIVGLGAAIIIGANLMNLKRARPAPA